MCIRKTKTEREWTRLAFGIETSITNSILQRKYNPDASSADSMRDVFRLKEIGTAIRALERLQNERLSENARRQVLRMFEISVRSLIPHPTPLDTTLIVHLRARLSHS